MDSQKTSEIVEKFVRRIGKGRFRLAYWLCQKTWKKNHRARELRLGKEVRIKFKKAELHSIVTKTHVKVRTYMTVTSPTGTMDVYADVNVIRESAPYKPSMEGKWGVNPISFLKWNQNGKELRKS